ncbi:hypothetical protein DNAM5_140 [Haloarcula californiae tailed virus 1]|uniref:Uncharacterized protein n=1 Tax=Haloarcula californiae tailed virus 1 TaxID=1273746 RepID=R4TMM6_9CAUD|nr:hypothetical protein M202_gp081 [Haloarcula californiae tailed virus 1]AGM11997.1 hypothetical protein DNAM5_140 [Haloarcula californiae tailed virus 1]
MSEIQNDPIGAAITVTFLVLGGCLGGATAIFEGYSAPVAVAFTLGGAALCGSLGRFL